MLPSIVPPFLKAYPDIRLEVIVEDGFVDVLAAGCDAGIRYDERLEQDMIAVPIGPRVQRFATAASPSYLAARGRPEHPRDLLAHACLRGQFASGAMPTWEFERDGEVVRVDPAGPLVVRLGAAADLAVGAAIAGLGIVHLFEDWLRPALDERRAGAGAGAVVAELLGTVPLLSRPPPSARAAARLRRFHQEPPVEWRPKPSGAELMPDRPLPFTEACITACQGARDPRHRRQHRCAVRDRNRLQRGGAVRDNKQVNDFVASVTALGRMGRRDDIGGAISALFCDDNRWINAQRID